MVGRSASSSMLMPRRQSGHLAGESNGRRTKAFSFRSQRRNSRTTGKKIPPRRLSVMVPGRAGSRRRLRGMERKRANSHSFKSHDDEVTMLEEIRRFYAPAGVDISQVARDDTSFYSDKALLVLQTHPLVLDLHLKYFLTV